MGLLSIYSSLWPYRMYSPAYQYTASAELIPVERCISVAVPERQAEVVSVIGLPFRTSHCKDSNRSNRSSDTFGSQDSSIPRLRHYHCIPVSCIYLSQLGTEQELRMTHKHREFSPIVICGHFLRPIFSLKKRVLIVNPTPHDTEHSDQGLQSLVLQIPVGVLSSASIFSSDSSLLLVALKFNIHSQFVCH